VSVVKIASVVTANVMIRRDVLLLANVIKNASVPLDVNVGKDVCALEQNSLAA